ncbi:CheB methylesterase domain-containing protein [Sagittula stellata]|uniref:CheB methylesterase domain-containing protein n=1 Tax=Sagittula stellata TaxID=52603 RepID=UPI001E61012F|nr:CheB methylesterase domain-containing protein [Sagittula stellata]
MPALWPACRGRGMATHSVIVATPDGLQRSRLARIVDNAPDFEVIASTSDLMNTYNEVEEHLPNAVLISEVLANLPEFEVMHALFSTLDIRWLVITARGAASARLARPHKPLRSSADLFSIPVDSSADTVIEQLKSLTRTAASRRPAAKKPTYCPPPAPRRTTGTQAPDLPRRSPTASTRGQGSPLILIGASTGGVDALLSVLDSFPADCPPTLIVQHTGSGFGESLASLLDRQCRARVELATGSRPLRPGVVTVGAGVRRHLVIEDCANGTLGLSGETPISGHVPSVDALFQSAVPLAPSIAAALLTGMGRDGAEGLKALRDAGAMTIAQDQATAVVYGMPRAAAELDAAVRIMPLNRIGPALLQHAAGSRQERREVIR